MPVECSRRSRADAGQLSLQTKSIVHQARENGISGSQIKSLIESWLLQYPIRRTDWISPHAALADLSRLLTGPKGRGAKAWNRLRRIAKVALEHYVAVASLVTVLATLFYGFAYARFFHALNVTPEQVGLSPPMILTRSALGGLLLTVVLSLVFFAGPIAVIPVRVDRAAEEEDARLRDFAVNLLFSLFACAFLFSAGSIRGYPHDPPFFLFGSIPLIAFVLSSFRLRRKVSGWSLSLKPLDFDFDKYLTALVSIALPAGLLVAALLTVEKADIYGRDAQDGFAVRDPSLVGLPFLGVQAEPALVTWSVDKPRWADVPRCLLFIGGSDGETFLYDHRSGHTFEARSSAVTLTFLNHAESCDVPINIRPPAIQRLANGRLSCSPGRWASPYGVLFRFQWIFHGLVLDNHARRERFFRDTHPWLLSAVRCRVAARNTSGKEVAVSSPRARITGTFRLND